MDLFRHPIYLLWTVLAVAGALAFGSFAERRRRRLARAFAREGILERLYPAEAVRARAVRHALLTAGLGLVLLALAGPQWGVELVTTTAKTLEVVIAVDTSLSMLSEDLKPDRMAKAKSMLAGLIDGMKGERLGLIAFAGEAHVQCPLTTDALAVKSLLKRLQVGMIPQPGTAIGNAVELGHKLLSKYPGQKALILLTDGEDHTGAMQEAARAAAESGVRVFIVGVGTPEGEPIPVKDASGRTIAYKKDSKGQTVVSKLGEQGLIELAQATGGAYYRASPSEAEIPALLDQLRHMDKSDSRSGSANRYRNRFRFPLLAAVLLLLAELAWPETRRRTRTGAAEAATDRPRAGSSASTAGSGTAPAVPSPAPSKPSAPAAAAALFLMCLPWTGCGLGSDLRLWRGNAKYAAEDYGEALKRYQKADPKDPKAPFNAGAALYKMGDFAGSQDLYASLLKDPSALKAAAPKAFYNLGNALFRQKQFPEAVESYKRCLLLDPSDDDCRHNLVLALRPPSSDKKNQGKGGKGGGGQDDKKPSGQQQQPPSGGQDQQKGMSKEDAERILRMVQEKEKDAQAKMQQAAPKEAPQGKEDDW